MSILIKDVLLDGKKNSVYIEENKIAEIGKKRDADTIIDGKDKALIPPFVNSHTHAAMTLVRSYADDMNLFEWLNTKIWPIEAKMSDDDVYWGTKLACLEMIKSGTTCFNDMYWHAFASGRAVEEMGIRAYLSAVFIDMFDKEKAEEQIRINENLWKRFQGFPDRIKFALGPHAPYTVSKESLEWARDFAKENNCLIHFHLAETEKEMKDFIKKEGKNPVRYLEEIGFLMPNLVSCHSVWLDNKNITAMKNHDVKIVHNPVSNMKLAVGKALPYAEMKKAGLCIALGTDGCASNNNLDMFQTMKFASLLQKFSTNTQTILPATEAVEMATRNGAVALGLNAGEIKEGKLADLLLIDLKKEYFAPNHNIVSNIAYAAHPDCVNTVICDGKVLMENRKVEGEEEIIMKATEAARKLAEK